MKKTRVTSDKKRSKLLILTVILQVVVVLTFTFRNWIYIQS